MSRFKIPIIIVVSILLALTLNSSMAQEDNVDVYGRTLPADAAPYEMQTWREICNAARTEIALSSVVSVYSRICDQHGFDQFSDSLVQLNQNMQLFPGAAESWEPTEDGLGWVFHLRGDQMWNDGTPVTATDWVRSFQFMVDPVNAYDFVWMWNGVIEGWDEAVAGEISPAEIGVEALDDNTLLIRTQNPFPPLPATTMYWPPMQAASLGEPGAWTPEYLLDPATSVSSGPFMVVEHVPGDHLLLEANPDYVGPRTPWLHQLIGVYGDQVNSSFIAFQNYEVDVVDYSHLKPADFVVISENEEMSANFRLHAGDFRADYLLFDTFNPPFDDVRVRLAFAKAVDRQAIADNVINVAGVEQVVPAYSFLAPGFPGWDAAGDFQDVQAYDCEAAQGLLAEAGYPNGEGFPAQELKLRGEGEGVMSWYVAVAASISQCLNIDIEINNMEQSAYMEGLNARPTTIQFGGVSYGMDYLDPANMLGSVWRSTGRHSWRVAEFDDLVNQADQMVGDREARMAMYHEAERILVEDVGGVFLFHRNLGKLFQPFIAGGQCFEPDNQGVSAWHWNNQFCWGEVYITQDVENYDTYRTQ